MQATRHSSLLPAAVTLSVFLPPLFFFRRRFCHAHSEYSRTHNRGVVAPYGLLALRLDVGSSRFLPAWGFHLRLASPRH